MAKTVPSDDADDSMVSRRSKYVDFSDAPLKEAED